MSDLLQKSVSELRAGLDSGDFSVTDLVTASLNKIEKLGELNAFITVEPEKVLAQAKTAEKLVKNGEGKKQALLGIPVAVKDIILTKGTKATCGSKILSNFVAPYDATVSRKLSESGAIVIGKTNLDEFAMGSSNETSHFGAVKNPWNKECVPGGSSGGSAVAVAARMAPLSLGTDTGGSIRQPASLTGIVGIKPTYGRVSRYGVIAYASSLDQIGPFATNVTDAALLTSIISGWDERDSTSVEKEVPDYLSKMAGSIKGLRVGIPDEYFISGLDSEVESAVKAAVKTIESMGAEIVQISLPHTELALPTYYVIAPAEASSNLARYDGVRYGYRTQDSENLLDLYSRTRAEGFGDEVKRRIMIGTYVLSSGYFDAYYLRAQRVRTLIAKDFKDAFATKCDLIACPVSPTTAFKIGSKVSDPLQMYLSDVFTIPLNLAGLPGISVPCGFDSKGLPIGLQLIGKAFDEETLFKVAYAYEQATEWTKKLPEIH